MEKGGFPDYILKLNEVAGQYNVCREAALAQ